jgi:hypothetical protein
LKILDLLSYPGEVSKKQETLLASSKMFPLAQTEFPGLVGDRAENLRGNVIFAHE